jgi:hypothetical protein
MLKRFEILGNNKGDCMFLEDIMYNKNYIVAVYRAGTRAEPFASYNHIYITCGYKVSIIDVMEINTYDLCALIQLAEEYFND